MRLGIVISHYGEDQQLLDCLESLRCGDAIKLHDSFKTLPFTEPSFMSSCPYGMIYIHNDNTLKTGFSAGNNVGIRKFLKLKMEAIWLLNNDTKGVNLENLVNRIQSRFEDNSIGILGFKILKMDEPDFIHHAGTGVCYPAGVHKSGHVSQGDYSVSSLERWVTFASVIIRREVFETIGLLDENFVNYYSDSDFCLRARAAGFKVLYDPELQILHKIGSSANPNDAQAQVLKLDMLKFQDKWMTGRLYFDLSQEYLEPCNQPSSNSSQGQ